MTSKEFIIWLNGFAGALEKKPNKKQWDEILNKLSSVEDDDITTLYKDLGNTVKKSIDKMKKRRKGFPGQPPDIFFE